MEGIFGTDDLENALLEVDGRVTRADVHAVVESLSSDPAVSASLHSTRSAKAITVWRWQEETMQDLEVQIIQPRGGRERIATVYFLRNA